MTKSRRRAAERQTRRDAKEAKREAKRAKKPAKPAVPDDPLAQFQVGRSWLSVRGGYAKSGEQASANGNLGFGLGYSRFVYRHVAVGLYGTFGLTTALSRWQQTLQWSGEMAAQIPTQTMALLQEPLVAEASTAAWQDYFLFNALLAMLSIFPALPCWRRTKYQAPTTPQAAGLNHGTRSCM